MVIREFRAGGRGSDYDMIETIEVHSSVDVISIERSDFLFSAEFERSNDDLLILGDDGHVFFIEDYFAGGQVPDLRAPEGGVLRGELVEVLAGPRSPGVYAQQGDVEGATPIGQVETLEGAATVQRADGTVEQLQVGTKVFQNDVIQTADGSTMSVTFADGTIFTMSENARMVLSELIYAPDSDNNSASFNLVQGAFVFVAGSVASSGNMEVNTPASTIGIRGTTVSVDIQTGPDGTATVTVSLNRDFDDGLGAITLTNNVDGTVTQITSTDSSWVINTSDGGTREVERDSEDAQIIQQAFDALEAAQERIEQGENFVEGDEADGDEPGEQEQAPEEGEGEVEDTDSEETGDEETGEPEAQGESEGEGEGDGQGDGEGDGEGADDGPGDGPGDNDGAGDGEGGPGGNDGGSPDDGPGDGPDTGPAEPQPAGTQQGSLGDGPGSVFTQSELTSLSELVSLVEELDGSQPDPDIIADDPFADDPVFEEVLEEETFEDDEPIVEDVADNSAPSFSLPNFAGTVGEDGSAVLGSFDFSGNAGDLDVELVAGSSFSLDGISIVGGVLVNATNLNVNLPYVVDPNALDINNTDLFESISLTGSAEDLEEALNGSGGPGDTGLVYHPSPNEDVQGTLTVTVGNENGQASATIYIDVAPSPDPPTANDDLLNRSEDDGVYLGNVTLNDTDPDTGDTKTVVSATDSGTSSAISLETATTLANGGVLTLYDDGQYEFNPNGDFDYLAAGQSASNDIVYTIEDDDGLQSTATLTITVTGTNDVPETNVTSATGNEDDASISVNLSGSDTDGSVASFAIKSLPTDGTLYSDASLTNAIALNDTVAATANAATVYFVPNADFNGTPSFTYAAVDNDGGEDASPATATITVNAVNDAPETDPATATGDEDDAYIAVNLSGSDTDGSVASFAIKSLPTDGTLYSDASLTNAIALNDTIAATANAATVYFVPNADFNGTPSFTYAAVDNDGLEDGTPATANITVNAVNDAPETDPATATGNEDDASIAVNLSGSDTDGSVASFAIKSLPTDGTLYSDASLTNVIALNDTIAATANAATVYFVPNADFNGTPNFTYAAVDNDGLEDSSPATATITVNAVNDAPETTNASSSGDEDAASIIIELNGNDVDGSIASYVIKTLPTDGTLYSDASLTNALSAGDPVSIGIEGTQVYFVPNANFNGTPSFTYAAVDNDGLEDATPATATITVNAVNDLPLAANATATGNEDAVSIAVNLSGSDSDGTIASFRITGLPTDGAFFTDSGLGTAISQGDTVPATANAATIYFVPNADFNGPQSGSFAAIDDQGGQSAADAEITITVNAVNDAPETDPATATGDEDDASISVNLSGSDTDGSVASFAIKSLPTDGTLYSDASLTNAIALNGTVAATTNAATVYFVPNADFNGTPSFTYAAVDNDGLEDGTPATANITVNAVNDAPETDPATATGDEDDASISVNLSGSDTDGSVASFAIKTLPTDGTLYSDASLTNAIALNDTIAATANTATVYFVPNADFNGTPNFTYAAVDNDGLEDGTPATATITVNAINDAPVNAVPGPQTVDEDTSQAITGVSVTDVDGNLATTQLSVSNGVLNVTLSGAATISSGANGSATFTVSGTQADINATLASLAYQGNGDFNGSDLLTIVSADNDGSPLADTDTVSISVNAVDDTVADTFTTDEDTALNDTVASNDTFAGAATYSVDTDPGNGWLVLNPDGTFTYTPFENFNGTDTFTYDATDVNGVAETQLVTITVNGVDDPLTVTNSGVKIVPADVQAGDAFGSALGSVAVSGDGTALYVGAKDDSGHAPSAGTVYKLAVDGTVQTEFVSGDIAQSDKFGSSVATTTDGSKVVVGAPLDDDNGGESGSAYVFDGNGNQLFKLTAGDGTAGDQFGDAVDISGDGSLIVVGAHNEDANGAQSGAAYLFNGITGAQVAKLVPGDIAAGDQFGSRVKISGDGNTVLVGARSDDDNGSNSGSIYVFDSAGVQQAKLLPVTGAADDSFGDALAISADGSLIAVGAPGNDDQGNNAGAVYLFDNLGNQISVVYTEDAAADDLFGATVALSADGSTLVVGAYHDDVNGSNTGSVYVFDFATRNLIAKLTAPDGAAGEAFGNSISVSDDGTEIIVAPQTDSDKGANTGSAYTFHKVDDGYAHNGIVYFAEGEQDNQTFDQNTLGDILVSAQTGVTEHDPAIAALDNGQFVVVWQVGLEATQDAEIHFQIFNADGTKSGAEVTLPTGTGIDKYDPAVSAINGGFVVSYTRNDGAGPDAYVAGFNNDGTSKFAQVDVSDFATGVNSAIAVAGLNGGGFVAIWESSDQDGDGSGISGRIYDALGSAPSGSFVVNNAVVGNQYAANVVALSNGGFAVSFIGSSGDAMMQEFDSGGNRVGGEFQLSTAAAGAPQVTELANGDFLVSWDDTSGGLDTSGQSVRGIIFASGGSVVKSEFTLNASIVGDQNNHSVTALDDGGFYVVYDSADANGTGVHSQRYNANGNAVGGENIINFVEAGNQSTDRENGSPTVTQLDDGSIAAVWVSNAQDVFVTVLEPPVSVDIQTIDLTSIVTLEDVDTAGTPVIDPGSISVTTNTNSDVDGIDVLFNVDGTSISFDRGLFDHMENDERALVDIAFNAVLGGVATPHTITIAVDGFSDNFVNIIDDTSSPVSTSTGDDNVSGTNGGDVILSFGTTSNTFLGDQIFGLGGNDLLVGGDDGSEFFDGGDDDDTIIPGSSGYDGDYSVASYGNDRYNYGSFSSGFQGIWYSNLAATMTSITVAVDYMTNSASVQKEDGTGSVIGIDTIVDINNVTANGGLEVRGTQEADTYNIDAGAGNFFGVIAGKGADVFNFDSGFIRLSFRKAAVGTNGYAEDATEAAVIDLSNGTITSDGFGYSDVLNLDSSFTTSGSGNIIEIRGTDHADTLIGGPGDDRFIGERGHDYIDGKGGTDLVRFDRSGVESISADLENGFARGYWEETFINYTILNIENVRGSNGGVDFLTGSSVGNEIQGRRGLNVIEGLGGNDTLVAGNDTDIFVFEPGSGQDEINDFNPFEDRLVIAGRGFMSFGDLNASFDGSDTTLDLGSGDTIKVTGGDLTSLSAAEQAAFLAFNSQFAASTGSSLNGTANNDALIGNTGDDELLGNDGDDILIGGGGSDGYDNPFHGTGGKGNYLDGGAGNDIIISNGGVNFVIGGAGDDEIQASRLYYVSDAFSFADGTNVSYETSPGGIVANLSGSVQSGLQTGQVSDGFGGTDQLAGVTRIFDSPFDDTFFVDGSIQSYRGSTGAEIALSGGNDTVTFSGNGGRLSFSRATEAVSVNMAAGTATDRDTSNGNALGNDTFTNTVTRVQGSNYDDFIVGNAEDNRIRGRAGSDDIDGGGGTNNTVEHYSSLRSVFADLSLSSGQIVDDGTSRVIDSGIAALGRSSRYEYTSSGTDNLTNIQNVVGNHGADFLLGDSQNNSLTGLANNDVLIGNDGDDFLVGDYGDVTTGSGSFANLATYSLLSGGNDYLDGGAGFDNLFGGTGSDLFVFSSGADWDYISDFSIAGGDLLDVSAYGFADSSTFSFQYDSNNGWSTIGIFFDNSNPLDVIDDGVTLAGVDVSQLTAAERDDLFIFDVLTNGPTAQNIAGTAGDDFIRPVENNDDYTYTEATAGDDTYDLSLAYRTFPIIDYNSNNLTGPIIADIDGIANTATIDKGVDGTDTIRNIANSLDSGFYYSSGVSIRGTSGNDVFNISNPEDTWMSLRGNAGDDTFNLTNENIGAIQLDFRSGSSGINVDLSLASGQIINDGFGDTDTITGAGQGTNGNGIWEIRATDFVDTLVGSAHSESFITGASSDTVDGGDGFDRVRYDRVNVDAGITVDFSGTTGATTTGTVTGSVGSVAFTDTLTSIEYVRGTGFNDSLTGSQNVERLQGRDGMDTIVGNGGADILEGGSGNDTITVPDFGFLRADGGSGQDKLVLDASNETIDLSNIESISGIETFEVVGTGNTISITGENVQEASGEANSFIGSTLTGLAGDADTILVEGDAGNTLELLNSGQIAGASWVLDATESGSFANHTMYHYTDTVTVFARVLAEDNDVTVNIVTSSV